MKRTPIKSKADNLTDSLKDEEKSREQLILELKQLRWSVAKMETLGKQREPEIPAVAETKTSGFAGSENDDLYPIEFTYSIKDIVDIEQLRSIFQKFSRLTGFTVCLMSFPEQEVLIVNESCDACNKFHRAYPESAKHCVGSNACLTRHFNTLKEMNIGMCANGLVDGATPIIVRDKHIASLFIGQVLFEEPDIERFSKQAEVYGYDADEYLSALKMIPVVSREEFEQALSFLAELAVSIAEQGLFNLQTREYSIALRRGVVRLQKAEEVLCKSEEKFSMAFHSNPIPMAISRLPEVAFVDVNTAFVRVFGYWKQKIINSNLAVMGMLPPHGNCNSRENLKEKLIRNGWLTNEMVEICASDSTIRTVLLSAEILEIDEEMYALTMMEDITERKWAEEALKQREAFNYALFQYNPIATIVVDLEGRVARRNLAQEYFGSRSPNIGEVMYRDFASKHEIDMYAQMMECIRTKEAKDFPEMKYKDKFLSITIAPFDHGAIITSKDITKHKQVEEETARVKELEAIDKLRSALIASVSHELRTPLAVIKGMADTLIQTDVEWDRETEQDYLRTINAESDRLTHIVNDLVQMSQLEAGMMKMVKSPSVLSVVILQLGNQLESLAASNELKIDIPRTLPPVMIDEVRIGEVIINLVSNALVYSGEGLPVILEASQYDNEVVVSVTDQGIGIPAEQLGKVFDRFYRLESGVSRRRGGTGLGLAICKEIVAQHGGRIWVESEVGRGSKFSFSLPFAAVS